MTVEHLFTGHTFPAHQLDRSAVSREKRPVKRWAPHAPVTVQRSQRSSVELDMAHDGRFTMSSVSGRGFWP